MHDVIQQHLPLTELVLAVCAHPDEESFGLGAALSSWAEQGKRVNLLGIPPRVSVFYVCPVVPAEALESLITQVAELDMDEVRRLAGQQKSEPSRS
jgi:hypothetical protein